MCYSYKVYKARKQLAAIDWNFHMNLEAAITKAGQQIVTRKYNQRTKDWDVKIITVKKQFQYITVMMAKIFNMRKEDVDMVTRQVFLNESVRADLNLVLKIIQRIPRATIKIQRQEVEMCLIVLLT